jgi:PTS system nitrogen regulatory IIA component
MAMEIEDLITPESVVARLRATSKKQVLQELSKRAAETTGLNERAIFDVLLERERLGTTGVGDGIAIPHGKLAELSRLYGVFARLETPVDFDARVSRLLRDRATCEKLRGADTADALYALLTESRASHAA